MRFSHIILTIPIALLVIGTIQADPVIFIKNNSNRAVHIQPMGKGKQPLMQAQFVKAQGEYKEENVDANDVKGVDIKYCQKGVSCATPDDIRTNGTVMRFEFHDPSATKYYLKLDIDKNDTISLKQQEGKLGRTSNLKWSLAGNIIQDAISRPSLIPAAPTDMPPALPKPTPTASPKPDVTTTPQPIDAALVQKYVNKTYTQADLNKYIERVRIKYKNVGKIKYFVEGDKDERGKPLSLDNMPSFFLFCDFLLYNLDLSIKALYLSDEKTEDALASDVLHAYYNAKLIALRYPNNQVIQLLTKGTLEELLNKPIVGKSAVYIIQKFEQ